MPTLSLVHSGPSITSLEIANMVESRHTDVRRSIERLTKSGVIQLAPLAFSEQINNLGLPQRVKAYVFSGENGKRDSIVVVAQLSPQFTGRMVDRWMELEHKLAKAQAPVLSIENQSKVEAYDRLLASDGVVSLESIGQVYSLGRTRFYQRLRSLRVLTRRNRPYQVHVDAGRFIVRLSERDKCYGSEVYVTAKGATWLDELLNNPSN